MNYIKIFLGIFVVFSVSRFIPHPPNFTSVIALSFYIPAILGLRFIPAVVICFALTDYFIGLHNTIFYTWISILIIGLISIYFLNTKIKRFLGVLFSCIIFYLITNYGVWLEGSIYEPNFKGLIECYILAIPFFYYSIFSTIMYAIIIEVITYLFNKKSIFINYLKK